MISAFIFCNRLAARFAYLVGDFAGWHGLVPDFIYFDIRTSGDCYGLLSTRFLFTRAMRNGILDGCSDRTWR